ncbi:MAG: YajD family HNH nuclease [Desulfobulbaceae bacterium]|nr:YajD family HNH nuclease [Desulfobulbaceae bacterium]
MTAGNNDRDRLIAEGRRAHEERQKSYRERALKMFPWVCGKCAREFSGKKVRELTVHHRDHNHDNNPPDGSNWELLCIYCHDNEHQRDIDAQWAGAETGAKPGKPDKPEVTHNPFAALAGLMQEKK